MKLPKDLRGKYVTRAAFAKMQAENQRLKNDIKTIVMDTNGRGRAVFNKWRQEFQFWNDIQDGLREIAKRELPALKEKYNLK